MYERGLAHVGGDYNSHGLWDKYLAFARCQDDGPTVAQIYRRALGQPLKELDKYFER